jgi:hypothetical protein
MMLAHLDGLGRERDSMVVQGRDTNGKITYVRLYLYDLSRSRSTSPSRDSAGARSIATPDSVTVEPSLRCAPPGE